MASNRPRRRRALPGVTALEGRALLATGPVPIEAQQVTPGAQSYVNEAYIDLLGRTASQDEVLGGADLIESSPDGQGRFLTMLLRSQEYYEREVDGFYDRFLNRDPEDGAAAFWAGVLSRDHGGTLNTYDDVRVDILTSQEYFALAGNDNAQYVRNLYTDVLGRGFDPSGQGWVDLLNQGADPREVAYGIVDSPEADAVLVDRYYARFLDRDPEAAGLANYVGLLQQGVYPQTIVGGFLLSPEYSGLNDDVTVDLYAALQANPNYSTLVQAIQAAGLVDALNGADVNTLFAPTNDAFNALPAGTLANLLQPANQQQLRSLLLYHVLPGRYSAPELLDAGVLNSAQGAPIGFFQGSGGNLQVNGVDVIGRSQRVDNGAIYGIGSVLSIPNRNLLQTLQDDPNYSEFYRGIQAAGLDSSFSGANPSTVFAPSNAAFATLPAGYYDNLLLPQNRALLTDFVNYNLVSGAYSTPQLYGLGTTPTVQGASRIYGRSGLDYLVNDQVIATGNVISTNGYLQGLNTLAYPPNFPTGFSPTGAPIYT